MSKHDSYVAELVDEVEREESQTYFSEIETSMNFFCETVNDWLRITEATLHDLQISPNDSVSQVGSKTRPKPKRSSTSTKEAARIAELQAEVQALKQQQMLNESELHLKRQELDLRWKKEELELQTEYAKAVAREDAYAQAEAGYFASSDFDQPTSFSCFTCGI